MTTKASVILKQTLEWLADGHWISGEWVEFQDGPVYDAIYKPLHEGVYDDDDWTARIDKEAIERPLTLEDVATPKVGACSVGAMLIARQLTATNFEGDVRGRFTESPYTHRQVYVAPSFDSLANSSYETDPEFARAIDNLAVAAYVSFNDDKSVADAVTYLDDEYPTGDDRIEYVIGWNDGLGVGDDDKVIAVFTHAVALAEQQEVEAAL